MTTNAAGPSGAGRKRPTIRDVAKVAGVSYATVSRVLNGREWVSSAAIHAVHEAITSTGYITNHHARSLATGRSGSVAFLLTEPQHLLFEDPNFAILLRGVTKALAEREMTLLLMIASTPPERQRTITYLTAGHVDGVLLVSPHSGDPLLGQLVRAEIPVVACGRVLGFEQTISSVAADDRFGARNAVEHLIAAGRTRIATVAGPQDTSGGVDRINGYRDALERNGIAVEDRRIAYGDWTRQSATTAVRHLLSTAGDFDALFVASDAMAAATLPVLREAGRQVPADVRVVGFDDSGLAATTDPPMSTVHQPLDRISEEMVRLLNDLIGGRAPMSVIVPTSLVLRETSPAVPTAQPSQSPLVSP